VSCFRDIPDGPLGEGVCMPNLRKSLQCTDYNSYSGPYISGIALACCSLVQQAFIPTVVEWISTRDGWYGNVRNLVRRCQRIWSCPLESGCVGDAKPLTSISTWRRSKVRIGSPISPLLF
jgi:hypothetical protein